MNRRRRTVLTIVATLGALLVAAPVAPPASAGPPASFAFEAVGFHGPVNDQQGSPTTSDIPPCFPNCPEPIQYQYVNLVWQDNSTDETSFSVERCVVAIGAEQCGYNADDGDWEEIFRTPTASVPNSKGTVWRIRDDYLPLRKTHCYRVTSWDHDDWLGRSPSRCAAAAEPSAPPSNLEIINVSQHSFTVAFTRSAEYENAYRSYWRRADQTQWHLSWNCSAAANVGNGGSPGSCGELSDGRFNIVAGGSLEPLTAYCIRLISFNMSGESSPSPEICGSTVLNPPPGPDDLEATEVTATSVTLKWFDNADTEEYTRLYRRLGADPQGTGGGYQLLHEWGRTNGAITYEDSGLEAGTEYTYRVRMGNAAGFNQKHLVVETSPTAELAFNGPMVLSPTFPEPGEKITLTWYACNYGEAATGDFTDVAQLDGRTTTEQQVSSLAPGACYSRSVTTSGLPAGDHYYYVYLDANSAVDEQNENNNINYYGFNL
jgi:CARDB protein